MSWSSQGPRRGTIYLGVGVMIVALLVGLAAAFQPVGFVAALGGLALVLAGLVWPTAMVGLMFAVIVFAAMSTTGMMVGTLPITPSKIVVAMSMVLWTAHAVVTRQRIVRWHPVLGGLLVMVAIMGITLAASGEVTDRSIHEVIPLIMLIAMVALIWSALAEVSLDRLYRFLGILTVIALIVGLDLGADPSAANLRSAGTAGDPNYWATFVLLISPLVIGGLVDDDKPGVSVLIVALLLLVPLSVMRTGSRGGLLAALAISPGVLYLLRRRKLQLGIGAVAAVVVVPFVIDVPAVFARYMTLLVAARGGAHFADYSMGERATLQQRAIDLFQAHPFLGVGPGNYGVKAQMFSKEGVPKVAHNTYLQVAAEQGMLGVLAFALVAALIVRTLWIGWQTARDDRERDRVLGAALGLMAFGLMAGTLTLLHMPLAFLVLGFTLATVHHHRAPSG